MTKIRKTTGEHVCMSAPRGAQIRRLTCTWQPERHAHPSRAEEPQGTRPSPGDISVQNPCPLLASCAQGT